MTYRVAYVVLSTLLFWPVPAGAHQAKHDETVTAHHGGQARAVGPYHLELVAKDGELVLYVMDHSDKAIPTDGAKAKATIQHGYEKTRIQVELKPSDDNTLKGTGSFTINADTGIMIFIKLPDEEAYATRFTPLNPKGGTKRTERPSQPQRPHPH